MCQLPKQCLCMDVQVSSEFSFLADVASGCSEIGTTQYSVREGVDRKRLLDTIQDRSPSRSYTRHLDDVSPERKVSRYGVDDYSRPASRYTERPDPSWQSQDTMRRSGNGRDAPDTSRDMRAYADQDDRSTIVRPLPNHTACWILHRVQACECKACLLCMYMMDLGLVVTCVVYRRSKPGQLPDLSCKLCRTASMVLTGGRTLKSINLAGLSSNLTCQPQIAKDVPMLIGGSVRILRQSFHPAMTRTQLVDPQISSKKQQLCLMVCSLLYLLTFCVFAMCPRAPVSSERI